MRHWAFSCHTRPIHLGHQIQLAMNHIREQKQQIKLGAWDGTGTEMEPTHFPWLVPRTLLCYEAAHRQPYTEKSELMTETNEFPMTSSKKCYFVIRSTRLYDILAIYKYSITPFSLLFSSDIEFSTRVCATSDRDDRLRGKEPWAPAVQVYWEKAARTVRSIFGSCPKFTQPPSCLLQPAVLFPVFQGMGIALYGIKHCIVHPLNLVPCYNLDRWAKTLSTQTSRGQFSFEEKRSISRYRCLNFGVESIETTVWSKVRDTDIVLEGV
jgi:hypothetical protein